MSLAKQCGLTDAERVAMNLVILVLFVLYKAHTLRKQCYTFNYILARWKQRRTHECAAPEGHGLKHLICESVLDLVLMNKVVGEIKCILHTKYCHSKLDSAESNIQYFCLSQITE